MINPEMLEPFVSRLERLMPLALKTRNAILSLPLSGKGFKSGTFLLREEVSSAHCVVIASGFACRHKTVGDGGRQILSIHVPGDGIGMIGALGQNVDYNLQTLSEGTAALIPVAAVRALIEDHPQVTAALWLETATEASIQREWTANVGRRDARTRVAHLLCEIAERQATATQAERDSFRLPLTQEQLGDATGLTPVHINRVLGALGAENVIQRHGRQVTVPDWRHLAAVADFHPRYLQVRAGVTA